MHKKLKIGIILLAVVILGRVCLFNEKKETHTAIHISQKVIEIHLTPNFNNASITVNPKIFGVNIGFAFGRELDKDSGFVQLLRAMHPASLRFPGGTVANYYHPNLPVYGYVKNEIPFGLGVLYNIQSKRSENILYNYIRLSKLVGSSAVYCANLMTGTLEETMFVLDELKKHNIPILGVELGNEFNLLPYREKEFKSGKIYADKVKATAAAIRQKYPEIKIAIVGADIVPDDDNNQRSRFMRSWNQQLSEENFYDAYVWHFYANCANCDNNKNFDQVYVQNLQELAPFKTKKLDAISNGFQKIYGNHHKLWLTEWNISNTTFLENTFTQAAYVYESFLKMIDINIQQNNYIEISHLHAMDALINPYKGKMKALYAIDGENATMQYVAFKYLAETLSNDVFAATQQISCSDNAVRNQFLCRTFIRKTDNTVFIHFINRSGHKIRLHIDDTTIYNGTITSIDADVPYATIGKTVYEKEYPEKVKPARLQQKNSIQNNLDIAPFSLGYIAFKIDKK